MGKPKILAMLALIRLVSGVILDTVLIPEYSGHRATTKGNSAGVVPVRAF